MQKFDAHPEEGISILASDLRERADKSAVAAINRALRFTRKDVDPGRYHTGIQSVRGEAP